MPKTVVITRAEPGASETERRLCQLGYACVRLPALEIAPAAADGFEPPGADACYIFTSANGVRACLDAGWRTDLPAVCVGPATLAAAVEAGFASRYNADGNADDLYHLILNKFPVPEATAFVHVANADAVGDLVRRLRDAGYQARFAPLYSARPVPWVDVRQSWQHSVPDDAVVLIHSAKGASAVETWLGEGQIRTVDLSFVGVSERALGPLRNSGAGRLVSAERPNENELVKALQSLAQPGVSSE